MGFFGFFWGFVFIFKVFDYVIKSIWRYIIKKKKLRFYNFKIIFLFIFNKFMFSY